MIRKYNNKATEELKNLCWGRICTAVGFHSSDYEYETVTQWGKIKPDDVERLYKEGANIYAQMPDPQYRWIDCIIIAQNTAVLDRLLDLGAIDCKDKENFDKTLFMLHRVTEGILDNYYSDYEVFWYCLGMKTRDQMREEYDAFKKKYGYEPQWYESKYGWGSSKFDYTSYINRLKALEMSNQSTQRISRRKPKRLEKAKNEQRIQQKQ